MRGGYVGGQVRWLGEWCWILSGRQLRRLRVCVHARGSFAACVCVRVRCMCARVCWVLSVHPEVHAGLWMFVCAGSQIPALTKGSDDDVTVKNLGGDAVTVL